tara:strand:- start:1521 stop:1967 length:447 start_codon:yes stop_codon:yes gene_type:complete
MSAKMQRSYQKFLTEIVAEDLLTNYVARCMNTNTALVYKDKPEDQAGLEMVADLSAVGASHSASEQSNREILVMVGGRRSDLKTTVVRMSISDYNSKIFARYQGSLHSTENRALMWRNYIVDNNLLPAVRKCRDFLPSHREHSTYSTI